MLKILRRILGNVEFRVSGSFDSSYLLSTQYRYRLAPAMGGRGIMFTCFSESIQDALFDNGSLVFNCEVTFEMSPEIIPTADDLLLIAKGIRIRINMVLEDEMQKVNLPNKLEIAPINEANTLRTLEECLLVAYPRN